jgi:hypothetical protein
VHQVRFSLVPRFFTDIFTVETWEQAKARDWKVSGFPAPTTTRGGYFQSTFDRVKPGDVLLCYVKAPAKRWVGALRVESEMRLDYEDDVWGRDEGGRARFPARFQTTPLKVLDIDVGVPVEETIGVLTFLSSGAWSGMFRRSLNPVPQEDGERLLEMLDMPRKAVPVRVPRKRVRPKTQGAAAAVTAAATEGEPPAQRTAHTELVAKLIQLGETVGCSVWVASDERGKSLDDYVFAAHTLSEFPSVGLEPESRDLVRTIDVLWVKGNKIEAAFEVEATTSIFSGLLRMSDLVSLQPNIAFDLYIVAPDERGPTVRKQILRPTFEGFDPPLRKRCRYLSASKLNEALQKTVPLKGYVNPRAVNEFAEEVKVEI